MVENRGHFLRTGLEPIHLSCYEGYEGRKKRMEALNLKFGTVMKDQRRGSEIFNSVVYQNLLCLGDS